MERKKNWVLIFPPILILTLFASLVSLLKVDFYSRDSAIMAMKSHYLDLILLCIVVPIGILMFIFAYKKSYWAKLFIIGMMGYIGFMAGFNAFSLFFNELFLVYTAVFSLCVFGMLIGYKRECRSGNISNSPLSYKISGVFLLLFAVTAYVAWLMEIISSTINDLIPESISGMGLPSSVVHVFDMGFALPIIIFGAILLLKGKKSGLIISSIAASFIFFTCTSILIMESALKYFEMPFDVGKLYSMYVLAPLSIFPIIALFSSVSKLTKKGLLES